MCGTGGNGIKTIPNYTWNEVRKHNQADNKWLVVDGLIYDITNFAKRHPGGARIISHYAGEDATVRSIISDAVTGTCYAPLPLT